MGSVGDDGASTMARDAALRERAHVEIDVGRTAARDLRERHLGRVLELPVIGRAELRAEEKHVVGLGEEYVARGGMMQPRARRERVPLVERSLSATVDRTGASRLRRARRVARGAHHLRDDYRPLGVRQRGGRIADGRQGLRAERRGIIMQRGASSLHGRLRRGGGEVRCKHVDRDGDVDGARTAGAREYARLRDGSVDLGRTADHERALTDRGGDVIASWHKV